MRKDNKGFSLVELIIVIAIMAILVGVAAPQYLKFVHNSKISADIQAAQEVVTAVGVAMADGKTAITVNEDGIATVNWANIGMSAAPASKFNGTWVFKGDSNGVISEVQLTTTEANAGKAGTFEVFPDPNNTTDGINAAYTGKGLKK